MTCHQFSSQAGNPGGTSCLNHRASREGSRSPERLELILIQHHAPNDWTFLAFPENFIYCINLYQAMYKFISDFDTYEFQVIVNPGKKIVFFVVNIVKIKCFYGYQVSPHPQKFLLIGSGISSPRHGSKPGVLTQPTKTKTC
jgi:hypothetical protein